MRYRLRTVALAYVGLLTVWTYAYELGAFAFSSPGVEVVSFAAGAFLARWRALLLVPAGALLTVPLGLAHGSWSFLGLEISALVALALGLAVRKVAERERFDRQEPLTSPPRLGRLAFYLLAGAIGLALPAAFPLDEAPVLETIVVVVGSLLAALVIAGRVGPRGLPWAVAGCLFSVPVFFFAALWAAAFDDDAPLAAVPLWLALAAPYLAGTLAGVGLVRELVGDSRRIGALAVGAVVVVAFASAAYAGDWLGRQGPPSARFATIDEFQGAYGPVAVGDPKETMFAALGEKARASLNESLLPTGVEDADGPNFIPTTSSVFYRYPDVTFWLARDGRIEGFELTSPDAETARGVEVGDGLEEVRTAYPELECGEAPSGDFGDYPFCSGRMRPGRVFIWFGGDPISDITVAGVPLG